MNTYQLNIVQKKILDYLSNSSRAREKFDVLASLLK